MKRTKKKISPEEISAQARRNILDKLNSAEGSMNNPLLSEFEDKGGSVFPVPDDLLKTFVKEFEEINGKVIVAETSDEAQKKLSAKLEKKGINEAFCKDENLLSNLSDLNLTNDEGRFVEMQAGITACEALIARTGSVMVSSAVSRQMNVFPPVHIVWAHSSQLVPFISDAFSWVKEKYGNGFPSQVSLITGPSRTADIEKTLVMGAHGPREMIVVIIKGHE